MIQLLGLRATSSGKKTHAFFEKKWAAPSVSELLRDPKKYVAQIPENERVNMYFTVHECHMEGPRDFSKQFVIPFDIDDVEETERDAVARVVCETVRAEYSKTGVLTSGNGIQLFVELEVPIESEKYFELERPTYNLLCALITSRLKAAGLSGAPDPSVFSPKRLMRMPETWNVKPKKGKKWAHVIQKHMEPHGWRLDKAVEISGLTKAGAISKDAFKKYPRVDVDAVLSGCEFLKWCKENAPSLSEEQWYAMVGILVHMPGGHALVHEFSKLDKARYSERETSAKAAHAEASAGPRTCKNISSLSDKCRDCPFNNKVISPISIKGEGYIATEDTGFYRVILDENGDPAGKMQPAYEDIVKFFNKKEGPTFTTNGGIVWTYVLEKNVWLHTDPQKIDNFIYEEMQPKPRSSIVNEARSTLIRSKYREPEWFDRARETINMKNGVYHIESGKLLEHDHKYGHRNILTYDYSANAKCPLFLKFLSDVTREDQALMDLLQEYMGYIISGSECFIHKALLFLGEGRNGKSTLNHVITHLAGKENVSSIPLDKLDDPQYALNLETALVNIGDENNPYSLIKSQAFKAAVAGETLMVKRLYTNPYPMLNKAKFIFNMNQMPVSSDRTMALRERVIFVPFDATFTKELGNVDLHLKKKLTKELPGIFNFAIEGYRRLRKKDDFTKSERSAEISDTCFDAIDDTTSWFNDYVDITKDKEDFLYVEDMYQRYIAWCEDTKRKHPETLGSFSMRTASLLTRSGASKTRKRKEGGRNPKTCFIGAKFIEEEEQF